MKPFPGSESTPSTGATSDATYQQAVMDGHNPHGLDDCPSGAYFVPSSTSRTLTASVCMEKGFWIN
ncbi:hypothetical protein DSCA_20420 [Desulfosarcina alkanivorans]|uniref:Uncharacterized protein n=1 Tax=Desulfosarcina alkanivorans TaxID=571177 RepID=A0A5K7YF26_9BACT|nr:hypothetical protein DSCA_20420 [Desulfosarcina alkanivorans]